MASFYTSTGGGDIWSSVIGGVATSTAALIDMLADKINAIRDVYASTMSGDGATNDGTSVETLGSLSMQQDQFDFVENLRKTDPGKLSKLLVACDGASAIDDPLLKQEYIKAFLSDTFQIE